MMLIMSATYNAVHLYVFLPSKSSLIIMQTLITMITCFLGYTFGLFIVVLA